jgi:hypothetical protein
MAAAWPVVADVKDWLRLQGEDTTDDAVVGNCLAAAIDWVTNRVGTKYTDPADPAYVGELPDQLFQAAIMRAGRVARRRDSVDGTVGWGDMGVIKIGTRDPDIESDITPYTVIVV